LSPSSRSKLKQELYSSKTLVPDHVALWCHNPKHDGVVVLRLQSTKSCTWKGNEC
jgi:hypothetical protein